VKQLKPGASEAFLNHYTTGTGDLPRVRARDGRSGSRSACMSLELESAHISVAICTRSHYPEAEERERE